MPSPRGMLNDKIATLMRQLDEEDLSADKRAELQAEYERYDAMWWQKAPLPNEFMQLSPEDYEAIPQALQATLPGLIESLEQAGDAAA